MQFAWHTDIGIKKSRNQDAYLVREAHTPKCGVALLMVCDGVGGLDSGEIASTDVVGAFARWFETGLPLRFIDAGGRFSDKGFARMKNEWIQILKERNAKMLEYGSKTKQRIGTTFTAVFMAEGYGALVGNVGDSRTYVTDNSGMICVTEDHTVAAQAVRAGKITKEEALSDPGRSVLTRCVGALPDVDADFFTMPLAAGQLWLLCSDGFRNKLSEDEIFSKLSPQQTKSREQLEENIINLTETCKGRGETDNITAVAALI